jgi:hypothetical protein
MENSRLQLQLRISVLLAACRAGAREMPPPLFLVRHFNDLGHLPEKKAIYLSVFGLTHSHPGVTAAAAKFAGQLLPRWPAEKWPMLDVELRRHSRFAGAGFYSGSDRRDRAAMVDKIEAAGPDRIAALVIMASHCSGFVRERALEELSLAGASASAPGVLEVLALRTSDWVGAVRERAKRAWHALLPLSDPARVVEILPLVLRRHEQRPNEEGGFVNSVLQFLGTPAGKRSLVAGLANPRPGAARASWKAAFLLGSPPAGWLEAGLCSAESWVRLQAGQTLAGGAQLPLLEKNLDRLSRDPFMPLRRLAIESTVAFFPDRLEALARNLLFDRSVAIRQLCQETLVLRFDVEPLSIYRNALAGALPPRRQSAALHGLAETGGAEERTFFAAGLSSPSPRVRAAAIAGLRRLADPPEIDLLFGFLGDPSPRVVRAAAEALARMPRELERLVKAYREERGLACRRALARLAAPIASWEGLSFQLELMHDADSVVQGTARAALRPPARGWRFGPLSPQKRAELETSLGSLAGVLSEVQRRRLQFILQTAVEETVVREP